MDIDPTTGEFTYDLDDLAELVGHYRAWHVTADMETDTWTEQVHDHFVYVALAWTPDSFDAYCLTDDDGLVEADLRSLTDDELATFASEAAGAGDGEGHAAAMVVIERRALDIPGYRIERATA